jgi:hypothetical protein
VGALGGAVLALALLSILALAWILWGRATGSLWLDDAYSIAVASRTPAGILEALRTDSWPPLYFLALHGWMKVAGSGEWAVRSLSLTAYMLAILVTGLAGAEATRSRAGGWTAALVAALSPVALQGSTAVRGYALLELWCALALLFFLRAFAPEGRSDRLSLGLFVVAGALGTFTHYWALFALAGLGVAGLAVLPRAVWPRLVATLALAVAPFLLLWTPTVLVQLRQGGQTAWMRRPGIPDLIGSVWTPVGGPVAVLGIVAAMALFVKPVRVRGELLRAAWGQPLARLAAVAAGVTFLVPFLIAQGRPSYAFRYGVAALPALAVLVALVLRVAEPRRALVGCALAALGAIGLAIGGVPSGGWRDRVAAADLANLVGPDDPLVFSGLSRVGLSYYLDRAAHPPAGPRLQFPADLLVHPGWIDVRQELARRPELEAEAAALAARIADDLRRRPGLRAWLLYREGSPIDVLLRAELDRRLRRSDVRSGPGDFFDRIARYDVP